MLEEEHQLASPHKEGPASGLVCTGPHGPPPFSVLSCSVLYVHLSFSRGTFVGLADPFVSGSSLGCVSGERDVERKARLDQRFL